jgi:hypothetical protein
LTPLDFLTGKPLAQDILIFAIPVCAPYGSLSNFKFKAKLIPGGALKKGQGK